MDAVRGTRNQYTVAVLIPMSLYVQLAFDAVTGGGNLGDIAIDDIYFSATCCLGKPLINQCQACAMHDFLCYEGIGQVVWPLQPQVFKLGNVVLPRHACD